MPELPEVETIRRGLEEVLEGRTIVTADARRADLRVPFPADLRQRVSGQKVEAALRRGKYLVLPLGSGNNIIIHLGMSGRIAICPAEVWAGPKKHDHLVLGTSDGMVVVLNDARRFGMVLVVGSPWQNHPAFAGMGPEPLGEAMTGAVLRGRFGKSRRPLKTALLDQKIIAGLGNIYVCEALYLAGLSPYTPCGTLTLTQADRLVAAIQEILGKAIKAGGSTLRDYARINGETGYFQFSFSVYDREGQKCPGCTCGANAGGGIRREVQAGRSTFYCPEKQETT